MPIAPHRNLSERAAHRTVTAEAATALFNSPVPVDWPVSGDETGREYGRDARRDMRSLWHSPGVRPASPTAGIRRGDSIRTWKGVGVVTRVGSIAGWYEIDGDEERWEINQVVEIIPAAN